MHDSEAYSSVPDTTVDRDMVDVDLPAGDVQARAVELADAVAAILQAWVPRTPAGAPDDDYDDGTNGCGCGGEDDDGEPICNCADSCGCRSCTHHRHAETARCHLRVPQEGRPYAWCGQPSRFKIRPFCTHRDSVSRAPSEGDPAGQRNGCVRLGDSIQWHYATYACSTQHARELIEQDRQRRRGGPDDALSAERTFYEVDSFRYEPDRVDVPGPLSDLPSLLDLALYSARAAVRGKFAEDRRRLDRELDFVRRFIALSLRRLIEYQTPQRDEDDE